MVPVGSEAGVAVGATAGVVGGVVGSVTGGVTGAGGVWSCAHPAQQTHAEAIAPPVQIPRDDTKRVGWPAMPDGTDA